MGSLLVCLLLLLPLQRGGRVTDAETVRTGDHFRVLCHFEDAGVAEAALAAAEATYRAATTIHGRDRVPADVRMDIHLLRTVAEYQGIERRLTRGNFKDNLAFSSYATRAAYIALQPEPDDELLAEIGLSDLTRHQIVHEAAHLVCYHGLGSYQFHPAWFSEGAAIWVAQETMDRERWSPGLERDPYTARDLVLAQLLVRRGALPRVNELLRGEVADMDLRERYAVWGLLFRFFAEGHAAGGSNREFDEVLWQYREIAPGRSFGRELRTVFEEVYGGRRIGSIDAEFREFVMGFEPRWDEPHRSLETNGDEWTQIAFPQAASRAWCTAPVGRGRYAVRGSVRILRGSWASVLLGRTANGWVEVVLWADGAASVVVEREEGGVRVCETLGDRPATREAGSAPLAFEVEVDGSRVAVRAGPGPALVARVEGRDLTGTWGLSTAAGGAAIWSRTRVE